MRFISGLQRLDGFCKGFDEELWTVLHHYDVVYAKGDIRFTCKDGFESYS